jgi:uracil DNA glycosylase
LILESHDLQSWEYVNEYQLRAKNEQVRQLVDALGVDASKLESLMGASATEANLKKTIPRPLSVKRGAGGRCVFLPFYYFASNLSSKIRLPLSILFFLG